MSAWQRLLRPALPLLGGILFYLGERVASATAAHWPLSIAGEAALAAALIWTLVLWRRSARSAPERAAAWRLTALPLVLFALAVVAYAASLHLAEKPALRDWAPPVQFAAALLLAVGAVWHLFLELAVWSQGAAAGDPRRVARAGLAGLNLGLLLALVITLNLALNKMPWQWDVAYFKTTDPSQATLDALKVLDAPIDAALFFTSGDAVGQLAEDYFRKLEGAAGGKVSVKRSDADLKPLEAKDFKARGNGVVVLRRGEQLKSIQLGPTFERARTQLKKFDGDVLDAVVDLSRERRTAYLTVGHGERNERAREDAETETGVSQLETQLRAKAYTVKPLGLAQGLGSAIPDDAALVGILGPVTPFSKPEAEALRRYLRRGGRLLAMLEPRPALRPPDPLEAVIAEYGIQMDNTVQANDRIFARRTYTDADHALLVTTAFGPNAAANTIRRVPDQFPLVFLGAGALRPGKEPANMQLRDAVREMPGTWGDLNRNFRFDAPAEKRDTLALVMGVGPIAPRPKPKPKPAEKPKDAAAAKSGAKDAATPAAAAEKAKEPPDPTAGLPSILVFADADAASDLLMGNRANAMLMGDGIAWLSGDEAPAGLASSEEDQRIQHAKGDDWLWFYLPVVGVPVLILALGIALVLRRRRLVGGAA